MRHGKTRNLAQRRIPSARQVAGPFREDFQFRLLRTILFSEGDLKKKREILGNFGSHLIIKDKNISTEASKDLLIIKNGLNEVLEARMGFEPEFQPSRQSKTDRVLAVGPAWLPLLDEFRTQNWRQIKEEIGLFPFAHGIVLQGAG